MNRLLSARGAFLLAVALMALSTSDFSNGGLRVSYCILFAAGLTSNRSSQYSRHHAAIPGGSVML